MIYKGRQHQKIFKSKMHVIYRTKSSDISCKKPWVVWYQRYRQKEFWNKNMFSFSKFQWWSFIENLLKYIVI